MVTILVAPPAVFAHKIIQGVNLLDIVSEQGHGLKVYFFYTFLNLPKIFSKLLVFTYFLTLFVVLTRYEESNEILVFWTNGINKITFINFIGKISLLFVITQLLFTIVIVPYTQNLAQEYLKNSSNLLTLQTCNYSEFQL